MKNIKTLFIAGIIMVTAASHAFAFSVNDFIAYYPMDGNANDISGNGINGTVFGAAIAASGYNGNAYQFDGINDYISLQLNINPSIYPQLTMGAWVSASSLFPPVRQVISNDNGLFDRSLAIDSRGGGTGWSAFSGNYGVVGYKPVVPNSWTFVAVSYNQTTPNVMLYVDGNTYSEPGIMGSGWNYTMIGKNPSFGEYFGGKIDEVFFINRALTKDELDSIRINGVAVPEPSSIALLSIGGIILAAIKIRRTGRLS